jgi:hypothetical protein
MRLSSIREPAAPLGRPDMGGSGSFLPNGILPGEDAVPETGIATSVAAEPRPILSEFWRSGLAKSVLGAISPAAEAAVCSRGGLRSRLLLSGGVLPEFTSVCVPTLKPATARFARQNHAPWKASLGKLASFLMPVCVHDPERITPSDARTIRKEYGQR